MGDTVFSTARAEELQEKFKQEKLEVPLAALRDVSKVPPTDGQVLTYDATTEEWKPAAGGGGGGGTNGHVIENNGTPLPQRANLNFTGAGVSVADSGGKTVVTIPGGGGGGSAYPDTVTIHTAAGTVNLTTGMQGYHFPGIAGVDFVLPAAAPDGTKFKIDTTQFGTSLVTSGGAIIFPTLSLSAQIPAGRKLNLMALNVTGFGLVWYAYNLPNFTNWAGNVTYQVGEIVEYNGAKWMCLNNLNTNNTPNESSTWWMKLTNDIVSVQGGPSYPDTDVTVSGGTPPTGGAGAVNFTTVNGGVSKLQVKGTFTGAGSGNTNMQVSFTTARGLDPNFPTWAANNVFIGWAQFLGQPAMACYLSVNTDSASVIFPAPIALNGDYVMDFFY